MSSNQCEVCNKNVNQDNCFTNRYGICVCTGCRTHDSEYVYIPQLEGDTVHVLGTWLGSKYDMTLARVSPRVLKEILNENQQIPKHTQKRMFGDTLRQLTDVCPEDLEYYRENERSMWEDWNEMMITGVVLRSLVLKKPIEILIPKMTQKLLEMGQKINQKKNIKKWKDFHEAKEFLKEVGMYCIRYCDELEEIVIRYKFEPEAHELLKKIRENAKRKKMIFEKKVFTDNDGNVFYALMIGKNINNQSERLFFESVFGENDVGGEVLFFKSKNKCHRTYEWIVKNTMNA